MGSNVTLPVCLFRRAGPAPTLFGLVEGGLNGLRGHPLPHEALGHSGTDRLAGQIAENESP